MKMPRQIWEYPVSAPSFTIQMPVGARVLSVQCQRGHPQMWVLVDSAETKTMPRKFVFYGTGHPTPHWPGEFIGTFQLEDGDLVFHLFDLT